jgi:hypothetical protein
MSAVSTFEVVYKIKKNTNRLAHGGCMGRCLQSSVGHAGWPYRRAVRPQPPRATAVTVVTMFGGQS